MTSLRQNENKHDLSDQSLSSCESVVSEVQSPVNISNANQTNNNEQQSLSPNNAEVQSVQTQNEQDQVRDNLVEDEQQPEENKFVRCAKTVGTKIYNALYAAGGFLSDLFGITTPRYAYELHEYQRMQERNRQRELERENEANGGLTGDVEAPNNNQDPNHVL